VDFDISMDRSQVSCQPQKIADDAITIGLGEVGSDLGGAELPIFVPHQVDGDDVETRGQGTGHGNAAHKESNSTLPFSSSPRTASPEIQS
jgi:hypothetical protein